MHQVRSGKCMPSGKCKVHARTRIPRQLGLIVLMAIGLCCIQGIGRVLDKWINFRRRTRSGYGYLAQRTLNQSIFTNADGTQ